MEARFCQICYDTGKPESLYTNHFMMDIPGKNGVIVCPTLLAKKNGEETKKSHVYCMNCESSPIDEKCTRDILSETCTFCSDWCQRDYEHEVRGSYRRNVKDADAKVADAKT